jgi:uncharacterized damage-inducible protein DinB/heme-degrading monooxygenase HmoA
MIARIWDGVTEAGRGDEYAEYVRRTGVGDAVATEGNRGMYVFRREKGGRAHFRVVSFWESMDAIRRFAGEQPERARYYPEDEGFLLALEPEVVHYDVAVAAGVAPEGPADGGEAARLAEELRLVARDDAWHGPGLASLVANVSPEQAAARPIGGGHSIWECVLHIAAWNEVFLRRLAGETVDEPREGDFPVPAAPTAAAWDEARGWLGTSHERLAERVSHLGARELQAKVPGRDYNVAFMVRGAIRHAVYHSGQIGLLKKAR